MKLNQKLDKSEETKNKIFKVALTLFKEKGFQKTTMRDIAKKANISLGSTYYYYNSKEDLVHHFYELTTAHIEKKTRNEISKTTNFHDRFTSYIENQIEEFLPYKEMIVALVKSGVDPENVNSPFGSHTINLRTASIKLINDCIEGSNIKFDLKVKEYLPTLFWLYMMGIIFFWSFDKSTNHSRTKLLMNSSLRLVVNLMNIGRLPILNKVQKSLIDLFDKLWEKEKILSN